MPGMHQALLGAGGGVVFPAVYNPMQGAAASYSGNDPGSGNDAFITISVKRDGTWSVDDQGGVRGSGNWAQAPNATVGDVFFVKFTRVTIHSSTVGTFSDATTAVLALTGNRSAGCGTFYVAPQVEQIDVTYQVDISTDSGGTAVVSTTTIRIECQTLYE